MKRLSIFIFYSLLCFLSCFCLLGNIFCSMANASGTPEFKWKMPSSTKDFLWPIGVAVDSTGNIYVADICNHMIKKFDNSGQLLREWGVFGSGDGQFNFPAGIVTDVSGNIYVGDFHNHRIQKFDPNGQLLTKWGSEGTRDGQFSGPYGIAADGIGNIYVADTGNNRIQKFTSNGMFVTKWGDEGTDDGQFKWPYDIAVNSFGNNIYVADTLNNRIQKFVVSINLSNYLPIDPVKYGIRTFKWTYGRTGQYISEIKGTETVSYKSGETSGVKISNLFSDTNTAIIFNDNVNFKFLGFENHYFSTDCLLTNHPSCWSFNSLYDRMIIDQRPFSSVKKDLSECEEVNDQMLLISIQDLKVLKRNYNDAIIIWWLDLSYSFTTLNLQGKETNLGVTLPTSTDTQGYSVTGFDIFGFQTGPLASGDIDASSGSLNDLAELFSIIDISPPAAESVIGNSGGTVEVTTPSNEILGTFCNIPQGALTTDTEITIRKIETPSVLPSNIQLVGSIIYFGPDGLSFKSQVIVGLPYPSNVDPNKLDVYMYDLSNSKWEKISVSSINEAERKILIATTHFSLYALGQTQSIEDGDGGGGGGCFVTTVYRLIK